VNQAGFLFIWRDLQIRYEQTVIGVDWAVSIESEELAIFRIAYSRLRPSPGSHHPRFAVTQSGETGLQPSLDLVLNVLHFQSHATVRYEQRAYTGHHSLAACADLVCRSAASRGELPA
jgi:hypothetical protein